MNIPLSPTSNPFEKLAKSRILWLNGEVKDENMADLSAKLLLLSAQDANKDIYLYINSPGGSVTAGLVLIDMINLIPNDVVTIGTGMAASMGQLLLTIGAEGKRFITPNARVLLHQPSGGFGGVTTSVIEQSRLIGLMKNQLAQMTADRTGKTLKEINEAGDRDRWFDAKESLEFGFVDHIIHSLDDVVKLSALSNSKKATKSTSAKKEGK